MQNKNDFNELLKQHENSYYNIEIDSKKYKFKIKELLLLLNKDNFKEIISKPSINNIKTDYYLYALLRFVNEYNIIENYSLNNKITDNIKEIIKKDLYAINKLTETSYEIKEKYDININLKKDIVFSLPDDLNKLEKAIYIYIKLCTKLTYDQEYFATNQLGNPHLRHSKLENIKTIDFQNNEVVCYDFVAIYCKFLDMLKLNYTVIPKEDNNSVFGDGHVSILFRYDKYIIKVDSTKSILEGDLTFSKIGKDLNGIYTLNNNIDTKKEFKETVNKIYGEIKKEDNIESLDHINVKDDASYFYKLNIFFMNLNRTNLKGIDAYVYAIELKNKIFKDSNNMKLLIISNNKTNNNKQAMPLLIIIANPEGLDNEYYNTYYTYTDANRICLIGKEQIQQRINDNTFEYLDNDDIIPGIKNGKTKSYKI